MTILQFHHVKASRLPSSLCKVMEGIKLNYPETRTIFFAVSNVDFPSSIIGESLKCLHQNVPLLLVDSSEYVSESKGFHPTSVVKVEDSAVIVFFFDSLHKVSYD